MIHTKTPSARRIRLGVAAAALVVAAGHAAPSLAQLRAVPVQSVDEPARVPWQVTRPVVCGSANAAQSACLVSLDPVPAGKRLVVQHVGAYLVITRPAQFRPAYIALVPASNNSPLAFGSRARVFLSLVGEALNDFLYIAANQPVLAYFGANETPQILAVTEGFAGHVGFTSNQVTLSGYLIDCTVACAAIAP